MQTRSRSIAVLAGNPAFASILSHAIEDAGDYRVPVFSSIEGLSTFLRIAPVDLAVLDIDKPWVEIVATARAIKSHPRLANPLLDVIVLTRAVPIGNARPGSFIAAVLGKPVTPVQLIDCLESVLARRSEVRPQPPRRLQPARPRPALTLAVSQERRDNVIPLFGNRR